MRVRDAGDKVCPLFWPRSSTKLIRQGDVGVEVDKLRSDLAETKSSLAIDQALTTKQAWNARSAALRILSPSSWVVTFMISKLLKANLPRPLVARTAALGWFTSGLDDGATKVVELRRELHSEFGTPTAVSQVLCLCQCLYVRHVRGAVLRQRRKNKENQVVHILSATCVVRSTKGVSTVGDRILSRMHVSHEQRVGVSEKCRSIP